MSQDHLTMQTTPLCQSEDPLGGVFKPHGCEFPKNLKYSLIIFLIQCQLSVSVNCWPSTIYTYTYIYIYMCVCVCVCLIGRCSPRGFNEIRTIQSYFYIRVRGELGYIQQNYSHSLHLQAVKIHKSPQCAKSRAC